MQVALVIGKATSTCKHKTLANQRLLVAQPLQADDASADGPPILVLDYLGAGPGDRVMITSDGSGMRDMFGIENSPARWAVIGLVDEPR